MAHPIDSPPAHTRVRARGRIKLTRIARRPGRRRPATIFAWPALIGAVTVAGLAVGLIGDSGWDIAAWTGLAVPVIAARARRT